jgi:Tol biopolymer transport system component
MSPEQIEGRTVDARSDLFSFGCTFYEMLTGRRAFPGASSAEIAARIRAGALPDLTDIPPACRKLISRCLQTDPESRVQTAQELLSALRSIERDTARPRLRWLAGTLAALVILAAAALIWLRPNPRPPGPEQWVQLTRLPDSVSQPALSPDGRKLTFIRGANTFAGAGQIYIKTLPDGEALPLTHDNSEKMSPMFSPDASQIFYSTTDQQNRWNTWTIPASGGDPRLWWTNAGGLVWFGKHQALFSEIKNHDVHMAIVTADEKRASAHDVYLPSDVRAMAHRSYPSPDGRSVLLVEMDSKAVWLPCRLVPMDGSSPGRPVGPQGAGCTFAAWSPDGKWMYMSSSVGGTFHTWRQRFPDGQPEQITSGPTEEEGIAMAPDGRSFITAVALRQSALWLQDSGDERQVSSEGYSYDPKFAAGGKKLCYRVLKGNSPWTDPSELRVLDIDSGRSEPLLPGISVIGGQGLVYDVSPDGREIVAGALDREGKPRLWLASIDRSSPPHQIPNVQGEQPLFEKSGAILLRTGNVLHRVGRDGSGLQRAMEEPTLYRGTLSPDGRWLPVRLMGPSGYFTELYSLATSINQSSAPIQTAPAGAVDFYMKWTPDAKGIFLSVATSVSSDRGRTYAVPLPPGKMLPAIPAEGFRTEAQIAALPGARRIESFDLTPGPSPGMYAFARETLLRNLYRIPIP